VRDSLPQAEQTWLLIADVSGYTGYLASVELDHAQDILADLIGTVVTALRPGFRLAKLEGKATTRKRPATKRSTSSRASTAKKSPPSSS